MAPTPLTPPSSGSEGTSPLPGYQAGVFKRRPARRPSTGKFTWKPHHRRTLLVCHRLDLQAKDLVRVFNTLYQNDCALAGYPNGITRGSLQAQWQEHRKSTCKPWKEVLDSSEVDLELAKAEIKKCLAKDPSYVQPASTTRQPPSNTQWRTSARNTRVQTFDNQNTPRSTASTNDTAAPLSPPPTPPVRVQKPAVQACKPRQLVSVVIETRQKALVVSQPTRNTFNKSPRGMVSSDRTRTVGGRQIPIIGATDQDLDVKHPITPAEAHSAVPELLFRFYDDHSQGARTPGGEISGRHAWLPCRPPAPLPCDADCMFSAILSHLNHDETASELISTTSNLFFAMRLAAKSNANPHIYVIRGSALPRQKVFHLWPYHLRFLAEKLYYNGKYRNPSSHEYAIWATLPRTVIIYDFALADLERHLAGNPYMESLFRIDEMRTKKGQHNHSTRLQKDNLDMTLATIEGLARLMPTFGITVKSSAPVIARLISEIIRGFVVTLPKTTPTQWDILGGAFAYALSYHAKQTNVAEAYLVRAKEAFLSGARMGLGELNWHLNPQKQVRMVKKGVLLGLGVGVESVIDAARLESIRTFQQTIARFAYKDQEQHQGVDDDAMIDEDDTLVEAAKANCKDKDAMVEDDKDEEEEEAETDIEEAITFKTPPGSQRRRVSYAREATRRGSARSSGETFIIIDYSDDEDYVAESDEE
ncbi:unnamed protein product [Aureobasidium uvarum]|uniref:DUF7587 domain-containing protein n=1 Tax=Aureobasidium uvarum TaxID=2773716 RepID=A0A9N8PXM8_9PEZI|nr:unnamed protein product [Aureobasidium uvarum]